MIVMTIKINIVYPSVWVGTIETNGVKLNPAKQIGQIMLVAYKFYFLASIVWHSVAKHLTRPGFRSKLIESGNIKRDLR